MGSTNGGKENEVKVVGVRIVIDTFRLYKRWRLKMNHAFEDSEVSARARGFCSMLYNLVSPISQIVGNSRSLPLVTQVS